MTAPRVVGQVTLAEGASGGDAESVARALTERGAEAVGAVRSHAGAHLDLSVGGGDVTWDLLFADHAEADAFVARMSEGSFDALPDGIHAVEVARPELLAAESHRPGLVGVKRTLWLRVEPEAEADAVARFEAETPLLAQAVPAIRNWRWSRVPSSGTAATPMRWTHIWEQEFETVDGLQVDYMSSPVHWGYIDRWFDPEMPDRIVDLWLAHLACSETEPVLSWDAAS